MVDILWWFFLLASSAVQWVESTTVSCIEDQQDPRNYSETNPLRVGVLVPFSEPGGRSDDIYRWRSLSVAVSVAAEDFNRKNSSVVAALSLPLSCPVQLELTFLDSSGGGLDAAAAVLSGDGSDAHAIVGPAFSTVSGTVAVVSALKELPMVSYSATNPRLDDNEKFPYVARTIAADNATMEAAGAYFTDNDWGEVALLYLATDYGSTMADTLAAVCRDRKIKLSIAAYLDGDGGRSISDAVESVKNSGVRAIMLISMDGEEFATVVEAAADKKMFGPLYAWCVTDTVVDESLIKHGRHLKGAVKIGHWLQPPSDLTRSFAARFAKLSEAHYNEYGGLAQASRHAKLEEGYFLKAASDVSPFARYAYDAVMTVGLAACAASSRNYSSPSFGEEIYAEIGRVSFPGLSGHVEFDEYSSRLNTTSNVYFKNVVKSSGGGSSYDVVTIGGWSEDRGLFGSPPPGGRSASSHPLVATHNDGTYEPPSSVNPICRETISDGSHFFNETNGTCSNCPLGKEALQDETGCRLCEIGSARPSLQDGGCERCLRTNEYQPESGQTNCLVCPAHTQRDAGLVTDQAKPGKDISECECDPGFYSSVWNRGVDASKESGDWGETGVACRECPEGADCQGTTYAPQNQKGWWGEKRNPVEFYDCPNCDAKFKCLKEWKGTQCQYLRRHKFYAISELGPYKCLDSERISWLYVACAICGVLVLWFYVNFSLLDHYASLDLFTYHLQLTAIVLRFSYRHNLTHPLYDAWVFILDLALFDIDVFKPTCITPWSFTHGMALQFVLTGFVVLLISARLLRPILVKWVRDPTFRSLARINQSIRFDGGEFGEAAARAYSAAMSLLDIQHTTITYNAFASFRCEAFRGKRSSVMVFEPGMSCASTMGHFRLVAQSLVVAIFVLGVPHLVYLEIQSSYAKDNGVHGRRIQTRLGWALAAYRSPHHAWRIRRIYLTVWICLLSTILDNPLAQLTLALLGLNYARVVHETTRPYIHHRHNDLESWGFVFVSFVLTSSLMIAEYSRFENQWLFVVLSAQVTYFLRTVFASLVERRKRHQTADLLAKLRRKSERYHRTESPGPVISSASNSIKRRWHLATNLLRFSSKSSSTSPDNDDRIRKEPGATCSSNDDDDQEDEEGEKEFRLRSEAIGEIALTFEPAALRAFAAQVDKADLKLLEKVALEMHDTVCDESKTSIYSIDSRAAFWKAIVAPDQCRGIIDYVTTLQNLERQTFFRVMSGLQVYLSKTQEDLSRRVMHSLVTEGDRSSVLYYLCSCDEEEFGRCTEFLKRLVATYKDKYISRDVGQSLDSLHLDHALLPEGTSWRRFAVRKKQEVYRRVFAHSSTTTTTTLGASSAPGASEDLILQYDKRGGDQPPL